MGTSKCVLCREIIAIVSSSRGDPLWGFPALGLASYIPRPSLIEAQVIPAVVCRCAALVRYGGTSVYLEVVPR